MRLVESPRERLAEVTIGLATSPALSHVLLGAFLAATLQALLGDGSAAVAVASGLLWVLSVGLYAVADELVERIEEEERLDAWKDLIGGPDDSEFYGIE